MSSTETLQSAAEYVAAVRRVVPPTVWPQWIKDLPDWTGRWSRDERRIPAGDGDV